MKLYLNPNTVQIHNSAACMRILYIFLTGNNLSRKKIVDAMKLSYNHQTNFY